jgi:NAD(P)-dependent dehydrogenase (short-subunit alcohol dehydrogenase family)
MGILEGNTVIVTGAAQGIGAAYARGLAEEGANIVASDVLDPAPLVDEIVAAGGNAIGVVSDVTDEAQIAELVDRTKSA